MFNQIKITRAPACPVNMTDLMACIFNGPGLGDVIKSEDFSGCTRTVTVAYNTSRCELIDNAAAFLKAHGMELTQL